MPVGLLLIAIGVLTGRFGLHRRRSVLVLVLVATTVLLTLIRVLLGTVPSLLSVVLLIVLYAPAAITPRGDAEVERRVGRFFVRLMLGAAVLSVAQFALQSVGFPWQDYLADLVPAQFVLQDFNPGNPIFYGASIDRATAVVFLEPSILSLLLGLAVVVALRLRSGWLVVTVLLLGIVPTVAGNGAVIVGAAVLVLLFNRSRSRLVALVPAAALAAGAAALTPLGALFVQRSAEGGGENTSAGLRFVQPYVQLIPPALQNGLDALIGHGAGAAGTFIQDTTTDPLLATVLPKILFEFGLAGVVGILLPLMILILSPLRHRPELVGLAFAYFVVNASLQFPLIVDIVILAMLWLPDLGAHAHHEPQVVEGELPEAEALAAR